MVWPAPSEEEAPASSPASSLMNNDEYVQHLFQSVRTAGY
jgi:hypothetical protein